MDYEKCKIELDDLREQNVINQNEYDHLMSRVKIPYGDVLNNVKEKVYEVFRDTFYTTADALVIEKIFTVFKKHSDILKPYLKEEIDYGSD